MDINETNKLHQEIEELEGLSPENKWERERDIAERIRADGLKQLDLLEAFIKSHEGISKLQQEDAALFTVIATGTLDNAAVAVLIRVMPDMLKDIETVAKMMWMAGYRKAEEVARLEDLGK